MKRTIIILTAVLLAATACQREKDFEIVGEPSLTITVGEATAFTLDGGQYQLDIESFAYSLAANKNDNVLKASQFTVLSNLQWKIVPATGEEYDWIHPFPDHGQKEGRFIFKNTRNLKQTETREAYFNILVDKGKGWEPLEGMITVHQASSEDFLTMSAAKFDVSMSGGKSNLAILSNVPWTYSVEPMEDFATESLDWLTDNTGEHPLDQYVDTLRFVSAANDGAIRGANIHIYYTIGDVDHDDIVPLTQYGEAVTLEGFPVEWTVGNVSETGSVGTFVAEGVMQATTGSGTISYVRPPENAAFGAPELAVGSTGEPYVTGAWPGDYWEFRSAAPISAGTIAKIEFSTRPSTKGLRYWTLMYLDGDEWLPLGALSTVEIDGQEVSYNIPMTTGGSVNTQISSVFKVQNNTEAAAVRMVAAGREGADGTLYTAPGGYTIRLSNRSSDDLDVMPQISIVAAGTEVLVQSKVEISGLSDGMLTFEGTPAGPALLKVTSDHDFSVTPTVDWLTVTPAEGLASSSGVDVSVTCAPSSLSNMRKGYLTVKSGITVKQIPVIQSAAGQELVPFIAISGGNSLKLNQDAVTKEIQVQANVDVAAEVVQGSDWITDVSVVSTRAMAEYYELSFSVAANEANDREGRIRLYDTESGCESVLTVSQSGPVGTEFPVKWEFVDPASYVSGVDYSLDPTSNFLAATDKMSKLSLKRFSSTPVTPTYNNEGGYYRILSTGVYLGDYWLFKVPVKDQPAGTYTISYRMAASAAGPKFFILEYSTDGTSWTQVDTQTTSEAWANGSNARDVTWTYALSYTSNTANEAYDLEKSFHLPAITGFAYLQVRARVSDTMVCGRTKEMNGANHGGTNRLGHHAGITFTAD